MNNAVGHADFFPNGGHKQPNCNNNFICAHGEGSPLEFESNLEPFILSTENVRRFNQNWWLQFWRVF